MLSPRQIEVLTKAINPKRVLVAQGQSHLPAFDVEAHLTRVFGFEGWDREITQLWLVHETEAEKGGRTGWTVTYGCKLRLTVRDPEGNVVKVVDGCATGSANNLPSRGDAHDFAMKNADSYALKRCAKALGDQFGLSLYNKGSVERLIAGSVAYEGGEPGDDPPEPKSLGNDERHEEPAEATEPVRREPTPRPNTSAPAGISIAQRNKLRAILTAQGVRGDDAHPVVSAYIGRDITSLNDLTSAEAHKAIDKAVELERANAEREGRMV